AGSDVQNWLEMHQGGTVLVDRKTGEPNFYCIHHACVSVIGGIQPGTLARSLSPEYREAGLGARILMAMPPRSPKKWTDLEIHPDTMAAYENVLGKLAGLTFDVEDDGTPTPFLVRMNTSARSRWIEFYNSWAVEQSQAEGELASAFSKLEAYSVRL